MNIFASLKGLSKPFLLRHILGCFHRQSRLDLQKCPILPKQCNTFHIILIPVVHCLKHRLHLTFLVFYDVIIQSIRKPHHTVNVLRHGDIDLLRQLLIILHHSLFLLLFVIAGNKNTHKTRNTQCQYHNNGIYDISHALLQQKLQIFLFQFFPHNGSLYFLSALPPALYRRNAKLFLKYVAEISGLRIPHFLCYHINFFICFLKKPHRFLHPHISQIFHKAHSRLFFKHTGEIGLRQSHLHCHFFQTDILISIFLMNMLFGKLNNAFCFILALLPKIAVQRQTLRLQPFQKASGLLMLF